MKKTGLLWCLLALALTACQPMPVKEKAEQPTANKIRPESVQIRNEPPVIRVRQRPAHLLQMDSDHLYWARILRRKEWVQPLHDKLEFAVNTNDDLFLHKPSKTLYLRIGQAWWSMPTDKTGKQWPRDTLRWQPVKTLPEGFELLPTNDPEWQAAYEAGRDPKPNPELEIITAFEPTVLVQLQGEPELQTIPGTELQWVANASEPMIYFDGQYYLLLSGRWFSAPVLTDDARWQYATPKLPADFSRLPKAAPFAALRASVPGTEEAKAAVAAWQKPHAHSVALESELEPVEWVNEPGLTPVKGTSLQRARNSHSEVLATPDHRYWRCEKRAWYVSTDLMGRWKPATALHPALAEIPVESPLFHCRFLWPEKVVDGQVVFQHTMGYGYHYVTDGVVVTGSGYPYATDFLFQPFWQDYIVPMPHPQTHGAGRDKPLGIWYLIQAHNYIRDPEKKPGWHDLLH